MQRLFRLFSLKPSWFIAVICLVQLLTHIPQLQKPAMGNHVWRQVNTLAVARNYHEEDMRFHLPRIDKRYHFSGVTGMSFPAYEYLLACTYKIFGYSEYNHRWLSLLISMLVLAGMYFLAFSFVRKPEYSAIVSLAMLGIPEFWYHSTNAIPDLLALCSMVWGWFWFRKWMEGNGLVYWAIATICISLAGLVKLPYLIPGLLMLNDLIRRRSAKHWVFSSISAALAGGSCLLWYRYANELTFKDWLYEFVLEMRWPSNLADFSRILAQNLFSDVPETWAGYALLPGLVVGMVWLWRAPGSRFTMLLALISVLVIYIPLQLQFRYHGYYALAFLPFLVLAAGFGYLKLLQSRYRSALWLLILAPVWAILRMGVNFKPGHQRIPSAALSAGFRDSARALSDPHVRWITGPDQSGCVYFYYLHAKGFPWYNLEEGQSRFKQFVDWGAAGFITNDTAALKQRLPSGISLIPAGHVREFYWYRIGHK